MLEELRSWKLLVGLRGKAQADIPSLAQTVEKIAMLVHECPEITELDLNPVIVDESGTRIADAKVVL
jgi:acetyltransferase